MDRATAETPRDLELPPDLVDEIMRTGKSRLVYTLAVCGGSPPVVSRVEHSTGFPALDRFLDSRIDTLGIDLPDADCVTASIVLWNIDRACDPPVTGDRRVPPRAAVR